MERESSLKELIEEELRSSRERLDAARILLENDKLIDAVNRIYYAIYYSMKAMLNSIGKDAKTHSGLISEFGLHFVKKKMVDKKFGTMARRIFEARESGDYTIGVVFDKDEVVNLLKDAKLFVRKAERVAKKNLKNY